MLKVWRQYHADSRVSFECFIFRDNIIYDTQLEYTPETLEEFMDEEISFCQVKLSSHSIDSFVEKIESEKRRMAITITWNDMIHCFILFNNIITDSYINTRGEESRLFSFTDFKQLLTRPNVELYNRIFNCNDEGEDNEISLVIAYPEDS